MTRDQRRDASVVAGVGLVARLLVVAWAARAIPPAADGVFYHQLATRLAEGQGYTWLWPDGAVTYAAHYPVGYPALVALGYAIFGANPAVAMVLNAIVGATAGVAGWSLVASWTSRRLALAAGLAVALHPVLVPYTAAIMTEGVTASLLVIAAAAAARARGSSRQRSWLVVTGIVMGVATLVRPQSLVLAPVLGWLAVIGAGARRPEGIFCHRRPLVATALVTLLALGVCAPWTARNCARMERCALVSVNGGWNLAIGTQTTTGAWQELVVPEACKLVFQEAAKDACFGREAMHVIADAPLAWIARAPAKLRATFDYFGAAPWYLHAASASRFPQGAKLALGAIETLASRLLLAAALVMLYRLPDPRAVGAAADSEGLEVPSGAATKLRRALAAVGLVACVLAPGTVGYLALALGILMLGRRVLGRAPLVVPFTAAVILMTAATHAVFFGSGRYGIVVVPFVTILAFARGPLRGGAWGPMLAASMSNRRSPVAGLPREGAAPRREESPSSTERDAG